VTSTRILDLLRLLAREPVAVLWAGAAWVLDRARHLDPVVAGLLAALLLALAGLLAWALQRRWTQGLAAAARRGPGAGAKLGARTVVGLELTHAPLFLPLKPFQLLGRAARALGRGLARLARRLRHRGQGGKTEQRPPEPPLLAASVGPSFLQAGIVTAGVYLLGRLARPLVAAELRTSPGLSPWQVLAFGRRPELAWLLPLERHPYLGALLALLFWLGIWWTAGFALRVARHATLGRNLIDRRRDPAVLPAWRSWAGAPELWRAAASYRRWAVWGLAATAPLLAWGWLHLGGDPYRIGGSELALAAVLWLAWCLDLSLTGALREAAATAPAEAAEAPAARGWLDVTAYLETELQVAPPEPFPVVPAAEPALASGDGAGREILSPLLVELLARAICDRDGSAGTAARLTRMQHDVLTTLALHGYVHTDPPITLDHLRLGPAEGDAVEDRSGHRSRNQVVLAPEAWGKTTLALLAVANHALVHTRSSLVVTATERRAAELHERFRQALEPSTLRWNVRVRAPGADLMNDLSRGIVPDVVVVSLHDLVTVLLDRAATFAPFLRTLGLLVVDDVDAFAGPIEVHAQLAFRRLILRVEELTGVEELGGRELAAPQVLILGADGMDEASEWAQSLCGVEAVTRRFGGAEDSAGDGAAAEHRVYRLRDFRQPAGEALGLAELVAACEALEVPWCYRPCGDSRRDLGRGPLLLPEEPRHATDRPEDACVLLLEGTWSEVRRERLRLRRAGVRFARERRHAVPGAGEPIALVTVVEADLEMAFTQLDERFALTPTLRSLPRPVLRPPTGLAVLPHLAAELTQHWTEVADVVRTFGTPAAGVLRGLARDGLLVAEEQRDVAPKANEYLRRVHVQALARAVRAGGNAVTAGLDATLPARVSQVELVSRRSVAVRDRTNLTTLCETDAASAHFVHYPGRIFKDARGTFVVVEHLADGGRTGVPGDVLVEPLLSDAVSSPRRRLRVELLSNDDLEGLADRGEQLRQAAGGDFFGPDAVLVGRCPVSLALRPVHIEVDHLATYRLGPIDREVRQRTVTPQAARQALRQRPLETVALGIFPNPAFENLEVEPAAADPEDETEAPQLTLDAARLLAAVMRAVLPTMVRGAGDSVGVALQVEPDGSGHEWPPGDHALGSQDAVFLFDADAGGNGAARAIYRDGVDVVLRLCRLVVERVLSLDRLRALHDEWASREEILAEGRRELGGARGLEALAAARREGDQDLRKRLLTWLDSRLRPEGGPEAQRELERRFASGSEEGEGDVIDLGRCWASADGAVTDLLWAKHRWHQAGGGEALLDVGFDRALLAAGRSLSTAAAGDDARLDAYGRLLDERRAKPGGDDLAPRPVTLPEGRAAAPGDAAEVLFRRLWALAADARESLAPLAQRLRTAHEERQTGRPVELAEALYRFVQALPASRRREGPDGLATPAAPVEVLLRRHGNELEKALVLALLLERSGVPSGCFVSLAEGRAAGAVPRAAELETGDPGAPGAVLEPPFWAEGAGGPRLLPVALDHPVEIGRLATGNTASWIFLPLADLPSRLVPGLRGRRAAPPREEGGKDDA
jgi:hypothetical protein